MTSREDWHLDKRVPIGLILIVAGQIAFGAWWASKTELRIVNVEERMIEMMQTIEANREFQIQQRVRLWNELNAVSRNQNTTQANLARLEGQLEQINRNIERLLDRLEQNRQNNGQR